MMHAYPPPEPEDDRPEWLRKIIRDRLYTSAKHEHEPEHKDTQRRCRVAGCGALLIDDEPAAAVGANLCALHRDLKRLRTRVLSGELTDWPAELDYCGAGPLSHSGMQTEQANAAKWGWLASVKAAIAFYNGIHGARFRFY